jgi:hypothetical protein
MDRVLYELFPCAPRPLRVAVLDRIHRIIAKLLFVGSISCSRGEIFSVTRGRGKEVPPARHGGPAGPGCDGRAGGGRVSEYALLGGDVYSPSCRQTGRGQRMRARTAVCAMGEDSGWEAACPRPSQLLWGAG